MILKRHVGLPVVGNDHHSTALIPAMFIRYPSSRWLRRRTFEWVIDAMGRTFCGATGKTITKFVNIINLITISRVYEGYIYS